MGLFYVEVHFLLHFGENSAFSRCDMSNVLVPRVIGCVRSRTASNFK